jgi:predicted DNA-binding protein
VKVVDSLGKKWLVLTKKSGCTSDTLLIHFMSMATTKKRINITMSPEMEEILTLLAQRDQVPEATKAAELLRDAMETEEDAVLARIAEERDTEDAEYISFEEVKRELEELKKSESKG